MSQTTSETSQIPTSATRHKNQGDAYFASSNYESSLKSYQSALSYLQPTGPITTRRTLHWTPLDLPCPPIPCSKESNVMDPSWKRVLEQGTGALS
eukprot:CAMPEP_0171298154 /NCGR_PEP_ID=MMETSP0816-20121228/6933_1 /TAXON_ID=420281 /ORGANISM="Proboscia inermis, Strain CCAP1064/1" /LENGTH=94 /DNA_ID=CAMNT_0011773003 /DNA_START=83 /DNA_END=367 /DNA_ORIENTATION=+